MNGNNVLVISRYGLDAQPYNTSDTSVTWETCSLRIWLNETFLNEAFTFKEQKAINTTTVDNSKSQCYWGWDYSNGGNNTQDMIFLLSYDEASKYFGVSYYYYNVIERGEGLHTKPRVKPTAYAIAQGAYHSDSSSKSKYQYKTADGAYCGSWWLRSPGPSQNEGAIVAPHGSLSYHDVNNTSGCVRPAFWLNLESSFVQSYIATGIWE